MKRFVPVVCVIAASTVFTGHVSAAVIFTDRAAWELAIESWVTEDFNSLAPFLVPEGISSLGLIERELRGPPNANQLGDAGAVGGQFAIDGTKNVIGHVLNGGVTHPSILFDEPVIGFAADWRSTHSGGTLLAMEFDGTTINFEDHLPGNGTGFLGVIADNPFARVDFDTVTNGAEAFGMDNLSFRVAVQDSDGDGIPDDEDACPNSDLSPTIVIGGCDSGVGNLLFEDGCTMADMVAECADGAVFHGQFVSCVALLAVQWRNAGLINDSEIGAIDRCAAIPGDLDGDGAVGVADLVILLGAWGPCRAHPDRCPADLDQDRSVGITDLLILLANWGP